MGTWPHILMVAAILAPLFLGQTESGATGSSFVRSKKDTPSAPQRITFRVLGMMKTKSGAT